MRSPAPTPSFLHVYDGTWAGDVDAAQLAGFLRTVVPGSTVDVRDSFLNYWLHAPGKDHPTELALAKRLARARVRQPDSKVTGDEALPGEVEFELRSLRRETPKPVAVLYDAHLMSVICGGLLAPREASAAHSHIVLTSQLLGTWDERQGRYHARSCLFGFPSLISTAGLVEGPARPRGFLVWLGDGDTSVEGGEGAREGRHLAHGDARLQQVVRGCLLQAVFYHVTGDPFCESPECRLFNAHWQEELIHAQARPGAGLCDRHRRIQEAWA